MDGNVCMTSLARFYCHQVLRNNINGKTFSMRLKRLIVKEFADAVLNFLKKGKDSVQIRES